MVQNEQGGVPSSWRFAQLLCQPTTADGFATSSPQVAMPGGAPQRFADGARDETPAKLGAARTIFVLGQSAISTSESSEPYCTCNHFTSISGTRTEDTAQSFQVKNCLFVCIFCVLVRVSVCVHL